MEINHYKGNTENYARTQRYNFFEKLIKKYNATYLLTAHHGDPNRNYSNENGQRL